jgi:MEMO1 family protein
MKPATRPPAVAGMFYPSDARELRDMVDGYLAARPVCDPPPKALIAPHAGYVYSGPIAGSAYAQIKAARETIRRVVLAGPSHRVGFRGLAVPACSHFETPLGSVEIDSGALADLRDLKQVVTMDAAHAHEHSLEVHLPFLQEILAQFRIVPLVVGDAAPSEIAEVFDRLWGGPETLFVISSDLSHYYDYRTAKRLDEETSRAIEALEPEAIRSEQACGRLPIQGLLQAARRHGLHAQTLDVRNSGDTAGPRDQVVGYGAYAFV